MKLSKNLSLSEVIKSNTAERRGIDNSPNETHLANLKYLEELFTEDAAFDSPNGMLKTTGRQNIIDMYTEVFQSRGPSFHWTHDIRVKLNNEDTSKKGINNKRKKPLPRIATILILSNG